MLISLQVTSLARYVLWAIEVLTRKTAVQNSEENTGVDAKIYL